MNLILAFIWLVLGVILIAMPWLDPVDGDGRSLASQLGSTQLVAVAAFLLAFYNVVRWRFSKSMTADRRAIRDALARHRSSRDHENAPTPQREVDPNFTFTDRPDA
jgi:hypothetical protein